MDTQLPTIETTRLFFRQPTPGDHVILDNLWRNEKVRSFLGGTVTEEAITQRLTTIHNHWNLHHFGLWVILEKTTNKIAGLCGLHHSEDDIEISYMFFPHFWGKGYAREAVITSLDYGFSTLQIDTIVAITQAANIKSRQLLDIVGLQYLNEFERFDAIQCLYKITKEEWDTL